MHNIIFETAVDDMLLGVELTTNLIRGTYGGAGTNVTIETHLMPKHMVVNDAETIIQAVQVKENHGMKIGVDFIKELCTTQDKTAGNGRKTTILMATEILKSSIELLKTGKITSKKLKEELDSLIPVIESEIDKRTTLITVDNVLGVATTASESETTGKLLQEIYQQIGSNGILTIEGSKTYDTSYKITNGVRFENTGMLSPEMVHDEEAIKDKRKEIKAVYENPVILVTKKKITTDEDINPLLKEMLMRDKKDLVIFTNDMDSGVASLLVNLHKNKEWNILIIKAPTLWQDFVFEDFAKCVGATVVEDATGLSFKNLKMEHLGTCGRIEVDSEDTVLTGIKDISDHMAHLQSKGDDESLLRLSWLATKSALLKLGANSQSDLSLKRLKANDANRSTYLALQYGVVKGGGICLYDIAHTLGTDDASKILCKALQAPLQQAMANYALPYQEYIDLITEDIVDASMVIKRAVRNAVGIASTILTSDAIVFIPDKTANEIQIELAYKNANPFNQ